jgi:hypothetical protein
VLVRAGDRDRERESVGADQQGVLGAVLYRDQWGWARSAHPLFGPDAYRVQGRSRPIEQALLPEPIQHPLMKLVPHPGGLPGPQPPPQVTPDPNPISTGSFFHGTPV